MKLRLTLIEVDFDITNEDVESIGKEFKDGHCEKCNRHFTTDLFHLRDDVTRWSQTHVVCCGVKRRFKQFQEYSVPFKSSWRRLYTYRSRGANKTDVERLCHKDGINPNDLDFDKSRTIPVERT